MAYSLYRGVNSDGTDRLQRSLLIGLPIIAAILSLGAFIHQHQANNPAGNGPKVIPIVSSLSSSGNPSQQGSGSPAATTSAPTASAIDLNTGSSGQLAAGSSSLGSGPSGSSSPIIGGRGAGPSGGSSSGTSGGTSLPDCSLNQIATVSCLVSACSPPATLSPGQKAIAGTNGTCLIIN